MRGIFECEPVSSFWLPRTVSTAAPYTNQRMISPNLLEHTLVYKAMPSTN